MRCVVRVQFCIGVGQMLHADLEMLYRSTFLLCGTKADLFLDGRLFGEDTYLVLQCERLDAQREPLEPVA